MTFSVVIPTFNRAAVVGGAIDSVLSQTVPPAEIIVVDDGSTDDTAAVLERYGGAITWRRQPNAGAAAARNLGISMARGRYVAFLDSDDAWAPWVIETYQHAVRESRSPSLIAGHGLAWERRDSAAREPVRLRGSRNFLDASRIRPAFFGMGGLAIRTDVLRGVGGFRASLLCAEDQDLCLRTGVADGFVEIESPPVFFQRRDLQHLSSHVHHTVAAARTLIADERAGRYPGGGEFAAARRGMICALARRAAEMSRTAGDGAAAFDLYRRCFAWHLRQRRWRFVFGFPLLGLRPRRTAS